MDFYFTKTKTLISIIDSDILKRFCIPKSQPISINEYSHESFINLIELMKTSTITVNDLKYVVLDPNNVPAALIPLMVVLGIDKDIIVLLKTLKLIK
jgi:hypothetical protein